MKYYQGDLVSYTGEKFRSDLGGKMGEICAPVGNQDGVYVVTFGGDDYVMGGAHLTTFQGHLKGSPEEKKARGPRVEKRHNRQDEESDSE
jgi:hypothetical protein